MVNGEESVSYAMPFCAGILAGVLLCRPSSPLSALPAWLAALSLPATLLIALYACRVSSGDGKRERAVPMLMAALFCCGVFCWASSTLRGNPHQPAEGSFIGACAGWMRDRLGQIPFSSGETNALVKALLTGDRSGLAEGTAELFRESGAAHLLALSGMHMGIIYLLLSKMLSVIGNSQPARASRFAVIVSASFFYALVTGASPSIIRAFIFILLSETASLTGRHSHPAPTLCFALTLQCAVSPEVIRSISFQMSYLAMCGIYFIFPVLKDWFPDPGKASWNAGAGIRHGAVLLPVRAMKKIWDSASLSLSCQLLTGPLAWWVFGSAPLYFLITNLIAVPLTSLLIPAALATAVLDTAGFCPGFMVGIVDFLSGCLEGSLEVISQLP